MVKSMRVVKEASTKKEGVSYFYLEIDFGYRKVKVFDFDNTLYPELCCVTAQEFYTLPVGKSLPVIFDLNSK